MHKIANQEHSFSPEDDARLSEDAKAIVGALLQKDADQRLGLPACLRACLHRACVAACLRGCLPACLRACLGACLPGCVAAWLRGCAPACRLTLSHCPSDYFSLCRCRRHCGCAGTPLVLSTHRFCRPRAHGAVSHLRADSHGSENSQRDRESHRDRQQQPSSIE